MRPTTRSVVLCSNYYLEVKVSQVTTMQDEERVQRLWQECKAGVKTLEAGLPELHRTLGDAFWAKCKAELGLSAFEAHALMDRAGYIIPRMPTNPTAPPKDDFKEKQLKLLKKNPERVVAIVREWYSERSI